MIFCHGGETVQERKASFRERFTNALEGTANAREGVTNANGIANVKENKHAREAITDAREGNN